VIPCAFGVWRADQKYLDVDQAVIFRHKCQEEISERYTNADKIRERQEKKEQAMRAEEEKKSMLKNPVMQEYMELRS
jgi:hypothetical protein